MSVIVLTQEPRVELSEDEWRDWLDRHQQSADDWPLTFWRYAMETRALEQGLSDEQAWEHYYAWRSRRESRETAELN